ncbi:diadenosine tetraphosphate hydrolase [Planotetraspora kaengkrachanensis]|uniref:DeoR family transcriptional regulator n=1 Tax=Planotetraspora kaengkrachanensis TaxID=575193 RepID=A0A8J3PYS5_9ACTN|nr:diadenosine tetraphosphate hydrolase [Planotetraspora kaengkrachanensis]GIG83512.1 DeoR family transcriptional regulator [Planotetraspora kaengkrachanensis]
MNADWRADRIGAAHKGENPTVLTRMKAGFAVIGDVQFLPGYCVLLVDDPAVTRLSELPFRRRMEYLMDMERLAEAVERVCGRTDPDFLRVNLEILGNTDPYLHAHIWPRYAWEPDEVVGRPVWLYPPDRWRDPAYALGPDHDDLRTALTTEVKRLAAS